MDTKVIIEAWREPAYDRARFNITVGDVVHRNLDWQIAWKILLANDVSPEAVLRAALDSQ